MTRPAVVLDDYALAAAPGLEQELAHAGAMVMRSFRGLPSPSLLRRYPGVAVLGGPDRFGLLSRLEMATASLTAPVIAILPEGVAPGPELRGPGVVDLVPAGSRAIAERVLLMARVPIVSGRADRARATAAGACSPRPPPSTAPVRGTSTIAVVSSTGGVWVLAALLRQLSPAGRVVAIAQHMDQEFVPFFAEWLQGVSGWRTELVTAPVPSAAGTAYVPAGGLDLVLEPGTVCGSPAGSRYVPSGDRLLRSAAQALGERAVGLVLSGMGCDGADGLAEIVRRGGRAVCQDPASAVVASMPESAVRKAPGALLATPDALAGTLARFGAEASP